LLLDAFAQAHEDGRLARRFRKEDDTVFGSSQLKHPIEDDGLPHTSKAGVKNGLRRPRIARTLDEGRAGRHGFLPTD
jgi:hypothetical protein